MGAMNLEDYPEALFSEKQRQIWHMHEKENKDFGEIAEHLDLKRGTVLYLWSELHEQIEDYKRNGNMALSLLSPRVRNILSNIGLTDQTKLKEAILSQRLKWFGHKIGRVLWQGRSIRVATWDNFLEMHDWARLPRPEVPAARPRGRQTKSEQE